jgi:hypothetical protein
VEAEVVATEALLVAQVAQGAEAQEAQLVQVLMAQLTQAAVVVVESTHLMVAQVVQA